MTEDPAPAPHRLEQASDAFLVDRAVDGDPQAFAALIRRYGRLLRWYASRVVGGSDDQDDVVQEAMITAWERLGALEDGAAVRSWLVRITTRKALDHVRNRKPHDDVDAVEPPAPEADGPAAAADASALNDSLAAALSTLPRAQQQVWSLREIGGAGYEEIAAELELPVSTVRGLLARARRALIVQMDGWR